MSSPALTPASKLSSGETLGRYQLLLPIARGGMALVWAARPTNETEGDALVAVKTLLPALSLDPRFAKMFVAESGLAKRIKHPNVCSVIESGEEQGTLYLVLEWLEGESLATVLEDSKGPVPLGVAVRIALDVACGLEAAHALASENGTPLGIVHRDVSPQNILVTDGGSSKILDFGVAKMRASDQRLTQSGYLKGKVGYMSPEQVYCEEVDGRTDVFALGVVLYEATTGKHPFAAQAQLGTLVNISSPEPAAPPKTLAPEYPQSLSELVTRAIDKDPAQRFANMSELRVALERVAAELGADQQTVREYFAKTSAHRQHARTLDLQKSIDELANPSRARQVTARSRSRRWLILASGIAACGLGSWWLVARHLETPPAPVVSASARALPPAAVQPAPRPLAEPATLAQSVTLPSAAPQPPRAPAKSHGNSELQRSLDHVLKSRE